MERFNAVGHLEPLHQGCLSPMISIEFPNRAGIYRETASDLVDFQGFSAGTLPIAAVYNQRPHNRSFA
jgi:hypothetical protein